MQTQFLLRSIFCFSLVMLFLAHTAQADEYSWNGPYVGIHIGGMFGDRDTRLVPGGYDTVFGPGSNPYGTFSTSGFVGGMLVGYNLKIMESLVVGLEFEGGGSTAQASITTSATAGWPANNKLSEDWNFRTRGRVGWAMGAWMPYVAGGLSVTRANLDLALNCFGQYYTDSEAKTLAGFNIGGGIEYAATSNLAVRVEYLYDDYGSSQIGTIKPDWNDRKFTSFNNSTFRLAASYLF